MTRVCRHPGFGAGGQGQGSARLARHFLQHVGMVALVLIGAAWLMSGCGAENYNFDNPYFNRKLFDQMDDFYMPARENFVEEHNPGLRKKMRFRNEICCGTYEKENMLREDDIRKDCYEEVFRTSEFRRSWNYFDADSIEPMAKRLICLQQCLWKKRGTMAGRYDPITGRLRDRYREGKGVREPNLNFPEVAVAKCLPYRNPDPNAYWLGFGGSGSECNRAYLDFSYCVWEELHADCPEQLWDADNSWCVKIKKYLQAVRRAS